LVIKITHLLTLTTQEVSINDKHSSSLRPTPKSNSHSWILWYILHTCIIILCEQSIFQFPTQSGQKMKTITLTDDQFDTLFEFVDQKVEYIVEKSIDYQDSEILNEWEDLMDVHNVLEETKDKYEQKLAKAQASQPVAEW